MGSFGGVRQFSLWGADFGHRVGGSGRSLGSQAISFVGSRLGAPCRWFREVLGELGNFPLWGADLGHCVGGFGWFFFGGRQFFLWGVDLGHCVGSFG
jgi:hypothetical protein